uniref:Uncharacterized protein n=1 Tax=Pararge aegeria TaxID=116150 RepID=S4P591_9NEOP
MYPPAIYSGLRNPLHLAQMPEIDPYHLDPGLMQEFRTNTPPVRVNAENSSVYYNKSSLDRGTSTLPHRKTSVTTQLETKPSALKPTESNARPTDEKHEGR